MIDTGCSNTVLDESLIPPKYIETLFLENQYQAEQMDGKLFTYTKKLAPCKISFFQNNILTNYLNFHGNISLRDFSLRRTKFIIGLNIIMNFFHGCTITSSGISFIGVLVLSYVFENKNTIPIKKKPCCTQCEGETLSQSQDKIHENLSEFSKCSLFDELTLEPPLDQLINPDYLYDLISS